MRGLISVPDLGLDPDLTTPQRARRRRHDRRGRGRRGIKMLPFLPGFFTRRELFDQIVIETVAEAARLCPQVHTIEFGVEEAPPSFPGYQDAQQPVLARFFPGNKSAHLPPRIILYRLPIQYPPRGEVSVRSCIRQVLSEQLSLYLGAEFPGLDPEC